MCGALKDVHVSGLQCFLPQKMLLCLLATPANARQLT